MYTYYSTLYYKKYSGLKKQLKKRNVDADGENAQWDDALEEDFKAHLKQELDKVKAFEESQSDQIMSHLAAYQTKVQDLMDRQDAHHSARDHDGDGDEEEDDESAFDDGIEQEFVDLEQDLETLIWETHEISEFLTFNLTV